MNERNVEALRELLSQVTSRTMAAEGLAGATVSVLTGKDAAEALALWLASRGVLVPSALTDGQVKEVLSWGPAVRSGHELGRHPVIAALERIAKGDGGNP